MHRRIMLHHKAIPNLFRDSHKHDLNKIHLDFISFLTEHDDKLSLRLLEAYAVKTSPDFSQLIIDISPYLDDFIANLFAIEKDIIALREKHAEFDVIYECKRQFVQRIALKKYEKKSLEAISGEIKKKYNSLGEHEFAVKVSVMQKQPELYAAELEEAALYAAYMVYYGKGGVLFDVPQKIDKDNLLRASRIEELKRSLYLGFDLRNHELKEGESLSEVKYCIYCHKQGKDYCRKGNPEISEGGCPLGQKISEMAYISSHGFDVAALAAIIIDNPLVPATGYRICNACMKACIYQKQEPVNIPLAETDILSRVLALPYGAEIYLLLSRWNPLDIASPLPKAKTGYNVLVVGLGPAGIALSYYMLREGHNVVAIDGSKIESLGIEGGTIESWSAIASPLSKFMPMGFGGVAEYGITHRWDKNKLLLLRLLLERQENFKYYDSIRLGSNITLAQVNNLGFDHVALCIGAGKPRFIDRPGFFARGVSTAASFLMHLQQNGAYLEESDPGLNISLPAIVVGCGLTAIDAAVELLNYYPVQVERLLSIYEKTGKKPNIVRIDEYIRHAEMLRLARNDKEKLKLLQEFGGVTICYRGKIKDSQAYKLNHEELEHAIATGVQFLENMVPEEVLTDDNRAVCSVRFSDDRVLNARIVLLAIGTEDNEFIDIDLGSNNISIFGDCNTEYQGSVVKALASAKNGYAKITEELKRKEPLFKADFGQLKDKLDYMLSSTVEAIIWHGEDLMELAVRSPLAAQNFKAGQLFRLQRYKKHYSPIILSGIDADESSGIVTLIINLNSDATKMCRTLSVGEKISLMGPTGEALELRSYENVLLIGYDITNIFFKSISKGLRKIGSIVTHLAIYSREHDYLAIEADKVILFHDDGKSILNKLIELSEEIAGIDTVIFMLPEVITEQIIQEQRMIFKSHVKIIRAIGAPMQCMMKGVCGRCIKKVKGRDGYIFACSKGYIQA